MIYLDERQVGFHTLAIGFPSIDGCHALVLQTDVGLYGFHIVGGERENDFSSRTEAFATYVKQHFFSAKHLHLYGTCFRTTKRGYVGNQLDGWKKEMKAYAKEIGLKGKVSGYDLAKTPGWPGASSAYVEYRRAFDNVQIMYKPWSQVTHTSTNSAGIKDKVNRKTTGTDGSVKAIKYGNNHTSSVNLAGGLSLVAAGSLDTFTY